MRTHRRQTQFDTQSTMVAETLQDLVSFDPEANGRFLSPARKHSQYGITTADVDAFRQALIGQLAEAWPANYASRARGTGAAAR